MEKHELTMSSLVAFNLSIQRNDFSTTVIVSSRYTLFYFGLSRSASVYSGVDNTGRIEPF